jgi:hypothetical protein
MKSKIVLIAYFISCIFTILSNTIGFRDGMLWSKIVIVPIIAYYYLLKSNYKINFLLVGVLLCCYLGDIYILLSPNDHTSVEIVCFFSAYLLLTFYLLPDFLKINYRFYENLVLIVSSSAVLTILAYYILNLKFEKIEIGTMVLVSYGTTLSFLMLISIAEYFRKSTGASFNLLFACLFFYCSDSFYIVNKFYEAFFIFDFIQITTQVFSYYFLVNFFVLREQKTSFYTKIDLL